MADHRDEDFYAWTAQQADLLRSGEVTEADVMGIAEELEAMGNSLQDQLTSRLGVLLAHLLKCRYQPERAGNSWRLTIAEQRRRIDRLLRKNPSLTHELDETFADAYGDAVLIAGRETGLPDETFPAACPWTLHQALTATDQSI